MASTASRSTSAASFSRCKSCNISEKKSLACKPSWEPGGKCPTTNRYSRSDQSNQTSLLQRVGRQDVLVVAVLIRLKCLISSLFRFFAAAALELGLGQAIQQQRALLESIRKPLRDILDRRPSSSLQEPVNAIHKLLPGSVQQVNRFQDYSEAFVSRGRPAPADPPASEASLEPVPTTTGPGRCGMFAPLSRKSSPNPEGSP